MQNPLAQPFNLSLEKRRRLGGALCEYLQDIETAHGPYFGNIRNHYRWYLAEPRAKVKNTPWPGAANVVVPLIRSAVDAMTSRMFSTLQGHRRRQWIAKSQNETFSKQYLGSVVEFLNWAAINEIDTFSPILDWIQESNILGCSVVQVVWDEQERMLLLPSKKGEGKRGPRTPIRTMVRRGPKIIHWPAAQILWTPGQELRTADFIATQSVLSWSDLTRLILHEEGFDKDDLDLLKGRTSSGSPGMEIRDEQGMRAGIDTTTTLKGSGPYDFRTIWLDYPILKALGQDPDDYRVYMDEADKEGVALPIVAEVMPDAKLVMRVRPNPYTNLGGTNFFDLYHRKMPGYPRGFGIAKGLEAMQAAMSTMACQGIDAVTLANSAPFMTTNPKIAKRTLTPGQGMLVDAMGDVQRLDLSKMIQPEIAIINLFQVFAERVSGVNDPLLGRESRSGGHPSPATNYLGMLEQSREMGSIPIRNMREQYSRIGETIASLYQLFDTDEEGRLTRVFGEADAARIKEWMFPTDATIAGNMEFDVFTLSETENPEAEMKKAIVIQQATQQYMAATQQLLAIIESPQIGPLQKQGAVKAMEILGKTHQQFLEAADFDEAQEAILELQQRGNDNAAALGQFRQFIEQQGQRGLAGGQGAAGVGPAPQVPPAAAPGTGPPVFGLPSGTLQ